MTAIVWSVIISVCLFARSFPVETERGGEERGAGGFSAAAVSNRWFSLSMMTGVFDFLLCLFVYGFGGLWEISCVQRKHKPSYVHGCRLIVARLLHVCW